MRYWLETLGCAKNQVDSEKLVGTLLAEGHREARGLADADLVVVNTCAFIEAAREESVATILDLADRKRADAKLVVTGCMAERYGEELQRALPEVERVAGFGVPIALTNKAQVNQFRPLASGPLVPSFDLLNLPRPPVDGPWAYVKVAEGCDRKCGFCAIPSFRGRQRSRTVAAICSEVESLEVQEVVLVAQDLASYGRDLGLRGAIVDLVGMVSRLVPRVRLLYLYPSQLSESLIDAMGACPYFDLSLQHASGPHLARMRRWGDGDRFLRRVERIRGHYADAAFRSSFIVGYPGETEEDHDRLLRFLEEVELDWAGFFAYSREEGTAGASSPDQVDPSLMAERLAECSELQDPITARRRLSLVGSEVSVLVDSPGVGRSHRESPDIDGVISIPKRLKPGTWAELRVTGAQGPDLEAA